MKRNSLSRRGFLARSTAMVGGAFAAPLVIPASAIGADATVAPSNRITIGMIGVGRQVITYNLPFFMSAPDAEVVALCDVDRWRIEVTEERVASFYGPNKRRCGKIPNCRRYRDFREVLARPDVDAVMISTPDQWHVPMSVAAVKAGKDVCCEKPLTRSIAEGRLLADRVRQHNRVFRTDSEFRSLPQFQRAVELVRNGRIGQLRTIRSAVPKGVFTSPEHVDMPVPEELDYELWTGPAPMRPYTEQRVHQRQGYERPGWMNIRDYCDGMICNWGTHLNDIAQWGNGTDRTGPVEVEGKGVYPPAGSMWNVLMEFEVRYRYANGVELFYKTETPYVRFEGTEGWVQAWFGRSPSGSPIEAEPKSILDSTIGPNEVQIPKIPEKRDFLDAIKTRGATLADAEIGHRTTSLCHLGHIAVQLGRRLTWEPEAEQFLGDDEANRMLALPPGREPWGI